MENNFSIGIIIPLYNAGDYITACLDSILSQDYQNFVIRIVDDGSKDHSSEICKDFATRYPEKVNYLRIPNGGANNARNLALRASTEDLIFFVDQDDFLNGVDNFRFINQHFQEHPSDDFLVFKYKEYFTQSQTYKERPDFTTGAISAKDNYARLKSFVQQGNIPISPWDKVFRRTFLIEKEIFLPVGYVAGDINWFIELINKADNFSVTNKVIYIYRRQVSTALTSGFSIKKYEDLLSIVEVETFRLKSSPTTAYTGLFYSFLAYELSILLALSTNLSSVQRKYYKERTGNLSWLYQYDENPKVRKVNLLRRLFGERLTARLLSLYIKYVVNKN